MIMELPVIVILYCVYLHRTRQFTFPVKVKAANFHHLRDT